MYMTYSQQYPWNIYPINNVDEDHIVFFLLESVSIRIISSNFSISRNAKVIFVESLKLITISFQSHKITFEDPLKSFLYQRFNFMLSFKLCILVIIQAS